MKMEDSGEKNVQFLGQYSSVSEFTQAASSAVLNVIKSAHGLPSAGDDFDFYSSFDSFRSLMDIESSRCIQLIQGMIRYHGVRGNVVAPRELNDLEDRFDALVDVNDQIFERAGIFLDEATGLKRDNPNLIVSSITPRFTTAGAVWNKSSPGNAKLSKSSYHLLAAKNVQRCQKMFKDKIDNSNRPFVPKIKDKPNALLPLEESLVIPNTASNSSTGDEDFPHPYQYELDHFKPTARQVSRTTPCRFSPLEETQLNFIDTDEQMTDLCLYLAQSDSFAVDLEAHSYRSYQGFVCLMQISTRSQDFIIDVIALRHAVPMMNEIFTNPEIVKVFHGADMDIEWLQRDFGIYVVNMFDTGQAARVLNFPRFGLSALLKHYCNVEADKRYQLADWRIRPLPDELIKYAREDTHYLLYIYDCMKSELLEKAGLQLNLLQTVLHKSKEVCARKYKKPPFNPDSYLMLYRKSKKVFNTQQLKALESMYSWRDRIARQEDESPGYILPNHMLLHIAENLPREPQGIIACCNPVPPYVKRNLNELHFMIKEARKVPLSKVNLNTRSKTEPAISQHPKYQINNVLHTPHDLTHQASAGVPNDTKKSLSVTVPITSEATLTIFSNKLQSPSPKGLAKALAIKSSFACPVDPFLPLADASREKGVEHITTEETMVVKHVQVERKWKLMRSTTAPSSTVDRIRTTYKLDIVRTEPTMEFEDTTSLKDIERQRVKESSSSASTTSMVSQKSSESVISKVKKVAAAKAAADAAPSTSGTASPSASGPSSTVPTKPTISQLQEEGFQGFDYSKVNFKDMYSERSTKPTGINKRSNPDTGLNLQSIKPGKKPKLAQATSNKSMSYGNSSNSGPKIFWPKK